MNRKWGIAIVSLLGIGSAIVPQLGFDPERASAVLGIIGLISGIIGGKAFGVNPDGTPATTVYVPPSPIKPYRDWHRDK